MVQSSQGGVWYLWKRGAEATASLSSLISIPELVISLVGKAYVTKMKLNLNFFSLGLQIPQIRYFQEVRDLHKFNYVQY